MELCNNCGCPFWEDKFIPANPVETLGDLLHKSSSPMDDSYLCQACKEAFGMLNMAGFGE